MENKINVGDQNTQQISQNPVNQPAQISLKRKKNYWMISTFILFLIILVSGFYNFTLKNNISSNQSLKLDKTDNISPKSVTNTPSSNIHTNAPSSNKKELDKYKQTFNHTNAVDKYGFEFQHDNSFKISTGETIDSLSSPERIFNVYLHNPEPYIEFGIGVTKKSESQIIAEYEKFAVNSEPITINGTNGQKYFWMGGEAGSVYQQTVILRKENFTYIIGSGSYTENDKRFMELLNTFKFSEFEPSQ